MTVKLPSQLPMLKPKEPNVLATWGLLLGTAIAIVGFTIWAIPISDIFQIDPDEGIQLTKATLHQQGFKLYTEIWSDHPPLYTVILSIWLTLWGHSIAAARVLTLLFTAVLLCALGWCIQITAGRWVAVLALVGLAGSSFFLQLSASVMIGLPMTALALVAIALILEFEQSGRSIWFIAAALAFALALQIKLIPIFLLPLIGLYLLTIPTNSSAAISVRISQVINLRIQRFLGRSQQPIDRFIPTWLRQGNWGLLIIWLSILVGSSIVILLLTAPPNWQQVIQPHLEPSLRKTYDFWAGVNKMLEPFALDYDLVLWGLFGAVVLGIQNRWRHLGLWWFITIIPLLTYHQPFWYHYHPLIVIPAVWLGADGLGATLRYLNRRWRLATVWAPTPLLSGFLVIILFGLSVHLFPSKWDEVRDDVRRLTERSLGYQRVLNDLQAQLAASNPSSSAAETISPTQAIPQPFQPGSAATSIQPSANIWLYTDLPMYAFYSGLSIPPELAVISNKRVYGGNLTAADFREVFEKYQPQSVIVGRIRKFRNIFQADLDGDFEMLSKSRIDKNETVLYYQRLPTE